MHYENYHFISEKYSMQYGIYYFFVKKCSSQ